MNDALRRFVVDTLRTDHIEVKFIVPHSSHLTPVSAESFDINPLTPTRFFLCETVMDVNLILLHIRGNKVSAYKNLWRLKQYFWIRSSQKLLNKL